VCAKILARWFSTLFFIAIVYAILIGYSSKKVLSKADKRIFNALVTGALIALALITQSHLTKDVRDLRWWILNRRPRSRHKVESILRAHSISQVIRLACKSRRLSIHIAVLSWVILFIGSQVGYASIVLCYSIEKSQSHALLRPGNVTIPNLTTVDTERVTNRTTSSVRAMRFVANSYGSISLAFDQEDYGQVPAPGTLWFSDDPLVFCNDTLCSYAFLETNTETLNNSRAIPVVVATNRTVSAVARCHSYPVIQGGNGTEPNFTIRTNGGDVVLALPQQAGLDQSTFMTRVANATSTCEDGSSVVSVLETSPTAPWYYNCTVSLTPVTNAHDPAHELGKDLSCFATAAIALQGYSSTSDRIGPIQSVVYPSASVYGIPLNGSTTDMGVLISRFTIGVISVAAIANSNLVVEGEAPWIGDVLNVTSWATIHLIFGLSAGLQILLAITAKWLADKVVVPHGAIDEAKIFKPMLTHRNPMAEVLDRPSSRKRGIQAVRWIYRCEYLGVGLYNVYMQECPSESQPLQVNRPRAAAPPTDPSSPDSSVVQKDGAEGARAKPHNQPGIPTTQNSRAWPTCQPRRGR